MKQVTITQLRQSAAPLLAEQQILEVTQSGQTVAYLVPVIVSTDQERAAIATSARYNPAHWLRELLNRAINRNTH